MAKGFDELIGNETVKSYLQRLIQSNQIPNALLFSGLDGIGKGLFAKTFAAQLLHTDNLENHPDYRVYTPEGKIGKHSIDSLREFSNEVYLPPYSGNYKIFVIHEADRMQTYGANALLKTLEEPAPQSLIILLTSAIERLLPTILSRCSTVRFQAISEPELSLFIRKKYHKTDADAAQIAQMAHGSLSAAERLMGNEGDPLRQMILQTLVGGKMNSYAQLQSTAQVISQSIEKMLKEEEEESEKLREQKYPNGLTAVQTQALQKEQEGLLALRLSQKAELIFETILSWHRDMHLLSVNGDRSYLLNPDKRDEVEQSLQRGEMLSLEYLQKVLKEAALSIERSTPLKNCLEHLFLQTQLR